MPHEPYVSISISLPLELVEKVDQLEGKSRSQKFRAALTKGYEMLTSSKLLKAIDHKLTELEELQKESLVAEASHL